MLKPGLFTVTFLTHIPGGGNARGHETAVSGEDDKTCIMVLSEPDQSSFSIIKEKANLMDSNVKIWLKFISIIERNPNAWVDFG